MEGQFGILLCVLYVLHKIDFNLLCNDLVREEVLNARTEYSSESICPPTSITKVFKGNREFLGVYVWKSWL